MGQIGKFDTDSPALQKRVKAHDKYGTKELNDWIFSKLRLEDNSRILDIGCGFGKQSIAMLRAGCNVVAVDASEESIDALNKSASNEDLSSKLQTICSKFDDMLLPDVTFDYAVSSYAFYYSEDRLKVLTQIYDNLKVGGAFFICGPAYSNNQGMKSFLEKAGVVFGEGSAPFMEDEGPKLFQQVFGNIEKSYFENEVIFPTAEEVWNYWSSHNMFNASIEDKFKENLDRHFSSANEFKTTKVAMGLFSTK